MAKKLVIDEQSVEGLELKLLNLELDKMDLLNQLWNKQTKLTELTIEINKVQKDIKKLKG